MVITWYNLDKSTQFPNPSEVPQRNWWGNWWWNLNSIFAGQRTPRMVDLQEWLQDGFAHEFHFFQTPRSEPWSKSLSCNVANNKKTTWVDFQIWSDCLSYFFPWHFWHPPRFFFSYPSPWGPPPADAISDHPLGLHPSRAVVQIRKGGLRGAAAAAAWDGPRCNWL